MTLEVRTSNINKMAKCSSLEEVISSCRVRQSIISFFLFQIEFVIVASVSLAANLVFLIIIGYACFVICNNRGDLKKAKRELVVERARGRMERARENRARVDNSRAKVEMKQESGGNKDVGRGDSVTFTGSEAIYLSEPRRSAAESPTEVTDTVPKRNDESDFFIFLLLFVLREMAVVIGGWQKYEKSHQRNILEEVSV